jgi:hypothetical protein
MIELCGVFLDFKRAYGSEQVIRARKWIASGFPTPAPNIVKWKVLERWGGRKTWIETGTYLGETTKHLGTISEKLISIEPEKKLFENALSKFKNYKNVTLINGTSEGELGLAISSLNEKEIQDISFWLDGHYSAGITFLGAEETPVNSELKTIADNLNRINNITIFVDDCRQFAKSDEPDNSYPTLSSLVMYANFHQLYWVIEHDIFIMTNRYRS